MLIIFLLCSLNHSDSAGVSGLSSASYTTGKSTLARTWLCDSPGADANDLKIGLLLGRKKRVAIGVAC
jgi:hypothetical protein